MAAAPDHRFLAASVHHWLVVTACRTTHNLDGLCQSQSYVTTDGQSVSLSWCQAPPEFQYQIFVTVRQLWVCWCRAPSLTRGRVCRLQLLLILASAVILGSESRRTHDHILLSPFREFLNRRAKSPYLYPPGIGWPSYYPRKWVLFSLPPTTRRATVEVFEPSLVGRSVGRYVKLLMAFASTIILGFALLEVHDQDFYFLLGMYVFRNGSSS
jgi:hypothetical protein